MPTSCNAYFLWCSKGLTIFTVSLFSSCFIALRKSLLLFENGSPQHRRHMPVASVPGSNTKPTLPPIPQGRKYTIVWHLILTWKTCSITCSAFSWPGCFSQLPTCKKEKKVFICLILSISFLCDSLNRICLLFFSCKSSSAFGNVISIFPLVINDFSSCFLLRNIRWQNLPGSL